MKLEMTFSYKITVESLYISEEASYIPASAPELAAAQFTYWASPEYGFS